MMASGAAGFSAVTGVFGGATSDGAGVGTEAQAGSGDAVALNWADGFASRGIMARPTAPATAPRRDRGTGSHAPPAAPSDPLADLPHPFGVRRHRRRELDKRVVQGVGVGGRRHWFSLSDFESASSSSSRARNLASPFAACDFTVPMLQPRSRADFGLGTVLVESQHHHCVAGAWEA